MSCSCHKPDGSKNIEGRVAPDSQCTTCALKHVEMAKEAWGEFLYEEENRRWCARHLRLAVEHLKIDHKDEALKCRETANIIELALDKDKKDVKIRLDKLYSRLLDLFKSDQPEYVQRLDGLQDLSSSSFSEVSSESVETIPIPNVNPDDVKTISIPNFTSDMNGGVMPLSMDTEKEESALPLETVFSSPFFNMMGQPIDRGTDIIIPLGPGSKSDNDELKILLRSIERNCTGIKRIILATRHVPEWLNKSKFTIVPLDDPEEHLKDANLIYKTLEVIKRCRVQSFVWCADDNVFMKEVKLDEIPRLHNPRGRNAFSPERKWCRRVINTFDYFKQLGIDIDYNFETHTPQYFRDAQGLLKAMEKVDYREQPGLTIMTAFYCSLKDVDKGLLQQDYKETFESAESVRNAKFDKMYVGYNDRAFIDGGLRERLFKVFKDKSRYES